MNEMDTKDIKKQLDEAYSWAVRKDYDTALSLCELVIRNHPNLPDGFRTRSQVYAHQANFIEAIKDITRAIEKSPAYPGDFFFRGWWRLENGEAGEAVRDLTEAINLGKAQVVGQHTESAYFFRALAYLQQGRNGEALRDCNHVRDDFLLYIRSGQVSKSQIVSEALLKH
jgi:tetratricopeptide (TPR) repeat protein